MSVHKEIKRVTTHTLQAMKTKGEKIAMLTSYDYSMARIVDEAGVDVILVGDSASNVMAGHETTLPITLDQMIYHASSVVRAVKRALVVVDLPFGSYQGDSKLALQSTIRIMKESGAHAVKLEGGAEIADSIRRILSAGVPVPSKYLRGEDSLASIVQMPRGVPVATFAIGEAGAANAALHAIAALATTDAALAARLQAFRERQTAAAREMRLPPA